MKGGTTPISTETRETRLVSPPPPSPGLHTFSSCPYINIHILPKWKWLHTKIFTIPLFSSAEQVAIECLYDVFWQTTDGLELVVWASGQSDQSWKVFKIIIHGNLDQAPGTGHPPWLDTPGHDNWRGGSRGTEPGQEWRVTKNIFNNCIKIFDTYHAVPALSPKVRHQLSSWVWWPGDAARQPDTVLGPRTHARCPAGVHTARTEHSEQESRASPTLSSMKKLRSGLYPLRDNTASWSLYQLLYWWRNIVRKKSVKASARCAMHCELKWSSIRSSDWIWWTVALQLKLLEFISHYMIRYASCELQKVLIHLVASCGRVTNKKRSCWRQLLWPPHWQDTCTLLHSPALSQQAIRQKCYYHLLNVIKQLTKFLRISEIQSLVQCLRFKIQIQTFPQLRAA